MLLGALLAVVGALLAAVCVWLAAVLGASLSLSSSFSSEAQVSVAEAVGASEGALLWSDSGGGEAKVGVLDCSEPEGWVPSLSLM